MFRSSLGRLTAIPLKPRHPWTARGLCQSSVRRNFRATPSRWQEQQSLPSFREEIARSRPEETFAEKVGKPGIRRQILFVLGASCFAFGYGAFTTNLETALWVQRLMPASTTSWTSFSITNADLRRAERVELVKKWRAWFVSITDTTSSIPKAIRPWLGAAYAAVINPYGNSTDGKRLCWKICLFNAAIWVAWKVKRLQPMMMVRFTHNPLSGLSFTLLTSMFSFGSAAYLYLVREEDKAAPQQLEVSASYHFLGFFISAGLFSGIVSHIVTNKFMYPRMIAQLAAPSNMVKTETWAHAVSASAAPAAAAAAKAAPKPILPSLGASGAIYASVTLTALAFPESQVSLMIPPTYPIDIQTGVGALVLLDIIGIARGWRFFDHWAHLGGAAFGVAYYAYGPMFWQNIRRTFGSDVITKQQNA
ncbi:hypothetical protein H0H92_012789 [Tricholoma furcatifolium]|nr:hypothetical protein H0H92_012789 [Tricholoma furcatifolium]